MLLQGCSNSIDSVVAKSPICHCGTALLQLDPAHVAAARWMDSLMAASFLVRPDEVGNKEAEK